jgi:hypothetical protein
MPDQTPETPKQRAARRLAVKAQKIAAADARFQAGVDSGEWARRREVENRWRGPWVEEKAK